MLRCVTTAVFAALVAFGGIGRAITLPSGFTSDLVVGGFSRPVAVTVAPDGRMFVAEKSGLLFLVKNGVRVATPILDLRAEVNKESDRGMLGLILHPNFASNGFLYVLYVHDDIAGLSHRNSNEAALQRLVRYTMVGDTLSTASRKVLFGATAADSPALCFTSHSVGTMRFGNDGSLIVSVGDGAHWDFVDVGQDVTSADPGCRAIYGAAQDIGSFRAQSLDTLAGKMLRLDPATGLGLPTNPFYNGNPASIRSRIWSSGFKNPFRFAIRAGTPGPGTMYIGDVGTDYFEEIDVSRGGENFGWPCFEGPNPQPAYSTNARSAPLCAPLSAAQVTKPAYSSPHNRTNRATGGIIEYSGTRYPAKYKGAFFFADYAQSFIKVMFVDASDRLVAVEDFATAATNPVDLEIDPATGDILYVAIMTGEVRRLRYSSSNQPPTVVAAAQPTGGAAPLTVVFSSNGTIDPEGDALTFDWDFGDGTAHASVANPTHVYVASGNFTVRLTVRDSRGNSAFAVVQVSTANSPPVAAITSPRDGFVFTDGQAVQFQGAASDPDNDTLAWHWDVELVHAAHVHFDQFASDLRVPPPFVAVSHGTGARYSYLVTLTVTDPRGLSARSQIHLIPAGLTNGAPLAAFTATPQVGVVPLTVAFDSAPTVDPDDDLLTAAWDFGDGTQGTGRQITHTFDRTGSYTTRLTITDILGARSSTTRIVEVQAPGTGGGTPTLLARWPFDEGRGTVAGDASGHGLNAAILDGTWGPGKIGTALVFNGTSTKTRVAANSFINVTGQLTIATWMRIASPTRDVHMRIVSKKPSIGANEGYSLVYNPAKQLLQLHGSGTRAATAIGIRLDTGWHHIAATINGTAARLYVDGIDRTSTGIVGALVAGSSPLAIGLEPSGAGLFSGALDDVRLYGRALTRTEVNGLIGGTNPLAVSVPLAVADAGAARWTFDEGGGSIAADELLALPCTLSESGWTAGHSGQAVAFTGARSGGDCGHVPALGFTGQATIATWMKIDDVNLDAFMRLVSTKASWNAATGFDLSYNPLRRLFEFHGGGIDAALATNVVVDTGWHHFAAVVNGSSVRLFVDGIDRTTDRVASPLAAGTGPLRLGRDGEGNFLVGALDDLYFSPRALTAEEVAALMKP